MYGTSVSDEQRLGCGDERPLPSDACVDPLRSLVFGMAPVTLSVLVLAD